MLKKVSCSCEDVFPSRCGLARKIRAYARRRKISQEAAMYSLENAKHPVAQTILKEVHQYARAKKIGFMVALRRIDNASKNL